MSDLPQRLRSIARGMDRYGDDGSITDRLLAAAAELERLERIEASLPKTADGVTLTPGMKVWLLYQGDIIEAVHSGYDPKSSYYAVASEYCYSTLEAAEKARDE